MYIYRVVLWSRAKLRNRYGASQKQPYSSVPKCRYHLFGLHAINSRQTALIIHGTENSLYYNNNDIRQYSSDVVETCTYIIHVCARRERERERESDGTSFLFSNIFLRTKKKSTCALWEERARRASVVRWESRHQFGAENPQQAVSWYRTYESL